MALERTSRFDKYFIDGDSKIDLAPYTRQSQKERAEPVSNDIDSLDSSQLAALNSMRSLELSLVQGPPGTGKTFASVVAIKCWITAMEKSCTDENGAVPPIIVAAQTNHALDQLLGHCLQEAIPFVRMGSRTEHEKIEEYSMFNMRNASKLRIPDQGKLTRQSVKKEIQGLIRKCFPSGLISHEDLYSMRIINEEQMASLENS